MIKCNYNNEVKITSKKPGDKVYLTEAELENAKISLNAKFDTKEKDGDLLYTKKVAQEYAKECVREAIILNSGSAVSDDMIKRAIDSVFTEDTKND